MDLSLARVLVSVAGAYAALGALFALPFVLRGVQRLDPQAQGGSWGFRLIILPASAALWPLLALRLLRRAGPREERNAHRDAVRA